MHLHYAGIAAYLNIDTVSFFYFTSSVCIRQDSCQ